MSPNMNQNPYQPIGGMGSPSGPQMGPTANIVGSSSMGTSNLPHSTPGNQASAGGSMYHTGGPSQSQLMGQSPTSHPSSSVGLQGPLAYLEKTTTNIGIPESRR